MDLGGFEEFGGDSSSRAGGLLTIGFVKWGMSGCDTWVLKPTFYEAESVCGQHDDLSYAELLVIAAAMKTEQPTLKHFPVS
jgi:hypothetical protein